MEPGKISFNLVACTTGGLLGFSLEATITRPICSIWEQLEEKVYERCDVARTTRFTSFWS